MFTHITTHSITNQSAQPLFCAFCFSSMHCKDGRGLEVSVSISIAPGRLSNYTKIVRICPRYIVVNQLPTAIVSDIVFD